MSRTLALVSIAECVFHHEPTINPKAESRIVEGNIGEGSLQIPGNSGGALLNARGELIGINSAIPSGGSGGNQGIGFAIIDRNGASNDVSLTLVKAPAGKNAHS
jgi:Trypsin